MWIALSHPNSDTKNYVMDTDDSIYRRSLYMYWKRTSPHPMMTLFDAPSRESSLCSVPRPAHRLSLLALFNETQRMETARKLAERLIKHDKQDNARMEYLFSLLTSRKPKTVEATALSELLGQAKSRLASRLRMRKKFYRRDCRPRMNLCNLLKWRRGLRWPPPYWQATPPFFFIKSLTDKLTMNHHDLFLDSGFQINRRQFFSAAPPSGSVQQRWLDCSVPIFSGSLHPPRACTTKQLPSG